MLGDACPTLDIGTNIFLNILGRMPFIGEKVSTVFTTSTYLGNGQWDVVPTLNVSEAEMREAVAMLEKAASVLENQKEAAQ